MLSSWEARSEGWVVCCEGLEEERLAKRWSRAVVLAALRLSEAWRGRWRERSSGCNGGGGDAADADDDGEDDWGGCEGGD